MTPDFSTTRGLRLTADGLTLDLAAYGSSLLRLRVWREQEPLEQGLYLARHLPAAPAAPAVRIVEDGEYLRLIAPTMVARVHRKSLLVDILTADGRRLLSEIAGSRDFPANAYSNPRDQHGATLAWQVGRDAAIVGCGQIQDGHTDRRGKVTEIIQTNTEAVVPVVVSADSWALVWNNASHSRFSESGGQVRWWSEVADGIDVFVAHAADGQGLIGAVQSVSGLPPQPPRWALGFFQSKERYKTAVEVLDVVAEFRRRDLPLDCIVQDWAYWGQWNDHPRWSSMTWDSAVFGDLPGMINALHTHYQVRLMISIWPSVGIGSALERDLRSQGATFDPGPGHWMGDGKIVVYDAFNPQARATYWRHANDGLFCHGVDAWWMDATEPEVRNTLVRIDQKMGWVSKPDNAAGSWARNLNGFVTPHVRGVAEGQRQAAPDKRVFILTRSAFLGSQSAGAATWSGDIAATWRIFHEQIAAGVSIAAAGIPWWTTDCGAFFPGNPHGGHFLPAAEACRDPAYRELFLRWFQFACCCPLMRSHGTGTAREPWCFGEPGTIFYDGQKDFLRLRYRLLPYLATESARIAAEGGSLIRPLSTEFPEDPAAANLNDQYLFGPAFLVAPVTRPILHPPCESVDILPPELTRLPDGHTGWHIRYRASDVEPWSTDEYPTYIDLVWSNGRCSQVGNANEFQVETETTLLAAVDGPHRLWIRALGAVTVEVDGHRVLTETDQGYERALAVELPLECGRTIHRKTEGREAKPRRGTWPSKAGSMTRLSVAV